MKYFFKAYLRKNEEYLNCIERKLRYGLSLPEGVQRRIYLGLKYIKLLYR